MKIPSRKFIVAVLLAGSLMACASPSTANAAEPIGGQAPEAGQTCDLFRQMIEGIDTLSTRQQQDLVDHMTDAVQDSGDAELMYAVYDFAQGWLDSNPKQFAYGMRKLSAQCHVPYQ